jgi:hypothetical protein
MLWRRIGGNRPASAGRGDRHCEILGGVASLAASATVLAVTEFARRPDWRRRNRPPSVLKRVLWLAAFVAVAFAASFLFMVVIPGR